MQKHVTCPKCKKSFWHLCDCLYDNLVRCWFCEHVFVVKGHD